MESPPRPGSTTTRWLMPAALVLVFWALKSAYPVFMPIAASAFLVALVHPLFAWVRRRANGLLGFLAAFLVVLAGFGVFFWLVGWALTTIVAELPQYQSEFERAYNGLRDRLSGMGVALPATERLIGGEESAGVGSGLVTSAAQTIGVKLQAFLTYFFLVLAFVALGLPEAHRYGRKLDDIGGAADRLRDAASEVGHKFRAYVAAVSVSALITAVLTAAFAFAVGLEFALVFALLSFLMNYVPTIGSIIAVIPPTLFAFVQFDGLTMPLTVFAGFAAIELTVGNYVAPRIEGRILSIAPTVVLAAIVFWGWLWGIVGALLSVPLTITVALVCERFEHTRWVSRIVKEE